MIYTTKGIAINHVHFNEKFWTSQLLPCLIEFYNKCIAPEIVSPIHELGLPIYMIYIINKLILISISLHHSTSDSLSVISESSSNF